MNCNFKKIPAYSILETMIAMVIIMLCLSLATSFFVSVERSTKRKEISMVLDLHRMGMRIKTDGNFSDQEYLDGAVRIKSTFHRYKDLNNVLELHLVAYGADNKPIAEWRELLLLK